METELKFQVPAAARTAVRRAVATASAQHTPLQAVYADTDDDRLAAAGLALRVRSEGARRVQALKGRGDGVLERIEHEVELPGPAAGEDAAVLPAPDLTRHDGTPAGRLLRRALGGAVAQTEPQTQAQTQAQRPEPGEVRPLFRTEVQRIHRRVRSSGATIEIAFDEGRIVAGEREIAVCELEFELLGGPPAALPALAARWVQRHGLWLDTRTKAERGWRLARDRTEVAATKAVASAIDLDAGCADAFATTLRAALAHCLPNAAEIGAGHGRPEHLHQLRVGLRRLRTALRLFGAWGPDAATAGALEAALREPFGWLGATRDSDVLRDTLLPALAAAGAPPLPGPDALDPRPAAADPGTVVRGPALNTLWLQLLALALAAPTAPAASTLPPLAQAARRVLKTAQRRVQADAVGFGTAPEALQHRTRKRLKRLRYATEFLLPLLPRRRARRALKVQRQALEAIGAYTDLLIAQDFFRSHAAGQPGVWFALGWLQARRELLLAQADKALARVAALPASWTAAGTAAKPRKSGKS